MAKFSTSFAAFIGTPAKEGTVTKTSIKTPDGVSAKLDGQVTSITDKEVKALIKKQDEVKAQGKGETEEGRKVTISKAFDGPAAVGVFYPNNGKAEVEVS